MSKTKTPEQILDEIGRICHMLPGRITGRPKKNPIYYNYNEYGRGKAKGDRAPRTHTGYVAAADVAKVQELVAQHKKFKKLVARYAELIFARTRRERRLPRKAKRKIPKPPTPEEPMKKIPKAPAPEKPIRVSTRRIEPGAEGLSSTPTPGL